MADLNIKIDSPEKVDLAIQTYARAKNAVEEFTRHRDEKVAELDKWLEEVSKPHQEIMEKMEALLREYHMETLQKDPDAKTIKRPVGTLKTKQETKWKYKDADLVRWLKANRPDLVRVKEEPDKRKLRKVAKVQGDAAFTEDGKKIEGVTITSEVSFNIEVE